FLSAIVLWKYAAVLLLGGFHQNVQRYDTVQPPLRHWHVYRQFLARFNLANKEI
ncbi:hypothetical protein PanWU01x14_241420, partial [Parasponia andersonii]